MFVPNVTKPLLCLSICGSMCSSVSKLKSFLSFDGYVLHNDAK